MCCGHTREHSPQSVQRPATWNARMMWNILSSKESTFAFCALSNFVLSKTHLRQLHAGHTLRQALQRMQRLSSFWKKANFLPGSCFDLLDLCKAVCVLCVAALADGLVENLVLLALADMAALQHAILIGERLFAVERLHGDVLVASSIVMFVMPLTPCSLIFS